MPSLSRLLILPVATPHCFGALIVQGLIVVDSPVASLQCPGLAAGDARPLRVLLSSRAPARRVDALEAIWICSTESRISASRSPARWATVVGRSSWI